MATVQTPEVFLLSQRCSRSWIQSTGWRGQHSGVGNARCPLRWLLITSTPWAEHSAALKTLPRSFGPPGCEQQLPGHREVWGRLRFPAATAGSPVTGTGLHREPFAPASMPPTFLIHQNSSPNTVSSREGSFSPCLMGQGGLSLSTCVCPAPHYLLHPSQWPALPGKTGVLWKQLKKGCKHPPSGRPRLNTRSHFIIPLNIPCPFRNGNADPQ